MTADSARAAHSRPGRSILRGSGSGVYRCGSDRAPTFAKAGIFPNDASIVRLVGAMMLEQNDEWSLNRRDTKLEGLQTVRDTAPTQLPAVAR